MLAWDVITPSLKKFNEYLAFSEKSAVLSVLGQASQEWLYLMHRAYFRALPLDLINVLTSMATDSG